MLCKKIIVSSTNSVMLTFSIHQKIFDHLKVENRYLFLINSFSSWVTKSFNKIKDDLVNKTKKNNLKNFHNIKLTCTSK